MPSFTILFIAAGALVASPPTAANEEPDQDDAAAKRIFSRVSFLFRTCDEVLQILGDPATISDHNETAGKDPLSPLSYVFDTGFGGLKYTFEFGRWDKPRVTVVRVEGLN